MNQSILTQPSILFGGGTKKIVGNLHISNCNDSVEIGYRMLVLFFLDMHSITNTKAIEKYFSNLNRNLLETLIKLFPEGISVFFISSLSKKIVKNNVVQHFSPIMILGSTCKVFFSRTKHFVTQARHKKQENNISFFFKRRDLR